MDTPIRVCILTTSFPRSLHDDAAPFIAQLARGYSEIGSSGVVIAPYDRNELVNDHCGAFRIERYRYGILRRGALAFGAGIMPNIRSRPWRILQAPMLILRMAQYAYREREHYDILHANWLPTFLAAWLVSLTTGKSYIGTLRGEDMKLLQSRAIRILLAPIFRRALSLTTVSESFCLLTKKLLPRYASKVHYIPNGVTVDTVSGDEVSTFWKGLGISPSRSLLFVGTVIPRKRVELLIDALSHPALASYQLIICGRLADTNYVSTLQSKIDAAHLAPRVHLLGPRSPHEVALLLAGSSYFVTASEFEGRPNAVLEALASGKVVIASGIEAHREIIEDQVNGFLFAPDEPAQIGAIVHQLSMDPAFREKIGSAAQKSVASYSWALCARRYREAVVTSIS